MKYKSYLIKVPEDIWKKFKLTVPRDITMHDGIVNLIKNEVNKNERRNKR